MSLPPKEDTVPKPEKMKQMRLPFAPIPKENALIRLKEEQEKERISVEKAREYKQRKLESERAAIELKNKEKERQW